ncbi:hypothetical protein Golax_011686 [Gossypium laxum]|uniref:Uncharacterized protein n=1 Tax=Gossypium laxum TaxID=34288 RepID=A0A7J8ZL77_9ROSI|nr:hypothetical protein [Gossypium laxum]
MSRMWWTSNDKTRGWAMMVWDKLCHPKGMGGIGSLRQTSVETYAFQGHFMFQARAAEALKEGFVWLVGDGNTVDIRRDQLGFEGLNRDSVYRSLLTNDERKVSDLWDNNRRCWKREMVIELYGNTMGDQYAIYPLFIMVLKIAERGIKTPMGSTRQSRLTLVFSWRIDHNIVIPPIPVSKSWMKPPKGYVKINFDVMVSNGSVGYKAIARDSDGFVLRCCYGFVDKLLDAN